MLYSRAGDYPPGQAHPRTPRRSRPTRRQGACPQCHGLGRVYEVTERSMVPDDSLTIRERAIAAWPPAWHGQNLRDILVTLGYDVDTPWRELPEEGPRLDPLHRRAAHRAGLRRLHARGRRGARSSARKSRATWAPSPARGATCCTPSRTPQSALMKKRVSQYMVSSECPLCHGKRLRRESLSVTFAGLDIAEMSRLPLKRLARAAAPVRRRHGARTRRKLAGEHPEKALVDAAHRRGSRGAPRRAARPRARLPLARAQHADALARRAAAAAARDAGALEPVRRGLRARRAVRRAASGRHRGAARRARPAQGVRQLAVRGRARARRDPPRRLDRRRRTGRGRAGRPHALQRPAGRARERRSTRRRGATSSATPSSPPRTAAPAGGMAAARGRHAQQPATTSTSPSRSASSPR